MSRARLRSSFAAWLITSAPALACRHEAVGDGPETVTVALTPALAERTSHECATTLQCAEPDCIEQEEMARVGELIQMRAQ